jgi:nitrile hydratase subunit beta
MSYQTHADLGGKANQQAVIPEAEGDLFHAPWEPAALALTLAAGATGAWNIDMSRRVRETLPGYDKLSYYAIWLLALERLLLETGLITAAELT